MIHPIPDGYYCVPSAICALTGADPTSVVVPAISRAERAAFLLQPPSAPGDAHPFSHHLARQVLLVERRR